LPAATAANSIHNKASATSTSPQGIAVTCLGHCHPVLIDALAQQSQRLWHTSNLYRIEQAERLGARLVENSFADKVFFCNSGAEAIEASYKTIRRYFFAKGQPHRNRIVSLSSAFHGRTLGAIASAFNSAHCDGFVVGDAGFDQAPFGDLDALLATITDNTAGIVLEPVQGEGGIRPADRAYLKAVRELCDDKGILLLFDEVQCGIARTGTLFAYEQLGVEPDILASAKGLGGGIPIGACLAREEIAAAMRAGSHGSTFGGNPLATAVGNAVLDVVLNDDFLIDVKHAGFHLRSGLEDLCARFPEQAQGRHRPGLDDWTAVPRRCSGAYSRSSRQVASSGQGWRQLYSLPAAAYREPSGNQRGLSDL
jgi:acetylornithine/N-succinyldiaminopimelate aminotransferase